MVIGLEGRGRPALNRPALHRDSYYDQVPAVLELHNARLEPFTVIYALRETS